MDNELKKRVDALERLVLTQQAMLVKLHEALSGHQQAVEAFAALLGIELEPMPAIAPPAN
jgi:uncharacterized coiled-coil protein SlyX